MSAIALLLTALLPALAAAQPRGNADPGEQVTAPPPRTPPPPRIEQPLEADSSPSELGELGLRRMSDGSYLYIDPNARFTARFQPDGQVFFADRWRRPSGTNRQKGKCCGMAPEGVMALNPFLGAPMKGPLEWFLEAYGYDLTTGAKTALLERTRELRTRLAVAWHLKNLARRLKMLEPELLQIWSDQKMPLADRKTYLFERWDECDEYFAIDPGEIPPDAIVKIDEARMQTAEDARRRIERFIRRHLPQGSRRGYTEADLKRLNARRVSEQSFRPYTAIGEAVSTRR